MVTPTTPSNGNPPYNNLPDYINPSIVDPLSTHQLLANNKRYFQRLAPPRVGVITNVSQTITDCDAITISAQFVELAEGCNQYPQFLFVRIREVIREETDYQLEYHFGYGYGYGYGGHVQQEQEQIVVFQEITPGSGVYEGYPHLSTNTGYGYSSTIVNANLYWDTDGWKVSNLIPEIIPLNNGSELNPLMAAGDAQYFDHTSYKAYSYEIQVLHFIPGDSAGNDPQFFDCGNQIYGAEDPIPYSLRYTDSSIIEAQFEIVGPTGVQYVKATSFNSTTGQAEYVFQPNQNGDYHFRVRGFSENSFSTRFGNRVTYTVVVPAPIISLDFSEEKTICLPYYGELAGITTATHQFKYVLTPSCYAIKEVQWSLDAGEWRGLTEYSGLLELRGLTPGVHTLRIKVLDEAGQYSLESIENFYVSLSTYVTIDDYPTDVICRPNRNTTVGGTKDPYSRIIDVRGVIAESLRFPTPSTWEADVYIFGDQLQIVEVEVENLLGLKASARQEIFLKARPPKFSVYGLSATTFSSKALLSGSRDRDTAIEISHNNGPWTEIVAASYETSWKYVLELVSETNVIKVRAVDQLCGLISDPTTVTTYYASSDLLTGTFQINNGDPTTNSTSVILSINTPLADRVLISNFDDFRENFEVAYSETITWTLSDEAGIKTVYLRFKTDNGLQSLVFSDDILLVASTATEPETVGEHSVQSLNASDLLTGNPLGTVVVVKDLRNGVYKVEIYLDAAAAVIGTTPVAIATTNATGYQVLPLTDTGTGIVLVDGVVEVTIVKGAADLYADHKKEILDVKTGESIIPLQYIISEDAKYFYAMLELPYYESKFQGAIQEIIETTSNTTKLSIDKVFSLLVNPAGTTTPYGYGYDSVFAQALANVPTPLKEHFATYPLTGVRFWYPTLAEFALVTEIDETPDSFIITIDKPISVFDSRFACRLEFTRQNAKYIDYRIDKSNGVVEFLNESTYATGNIQFEYEYAKINKGRPDGNWYKLCGLKFNDEVSIVIPQQQNRITFSQLKSICTRFYNGDEGTAPKIVRFIINNTIVYEDRTVDVIEGVEGYGYSYGYNGYGYRLSPAPGDQVVQFCAENTIDNETIVDSIRIEFLATTPCMYIGEVIVNAITPVIDTNLQVLVNGVVVHQASEAVTNTHDNYELRMEKGEIDVWHKGAYVTTVAVPGFDETRVKRLMGAGSRTSTDKVQAEFQLARDKKYYDQNPINIGLLGRFVAIEPNVRQQ